ncbi:MAG: dihydrolipoyl dehydrogenase [Anaerolineae bacterium]
MEEQFDVVVIGSGPGGYVAAIRASQLGFKVACIEKEKALGGTCLNVGCIPSKALLQSSELYWKFKNEGKEHGIETSALRLHFDQMMLRKQKVVEGFNRGIAALFAKNKIARFLGVGTLEDAHTIALQEEGGKRRIQARFIILATGSEPIALPFLPFDEKRIVSSTGALALSQVPRKMVVIGAGIIGVELGSVYARLGAEVVFIEFLDRICPSLDESISRGLQQIFERQGLRFHLSSKVVAADINSTEIVLKASLAGALPSEVHADVVLVAIGRKAYTKDLGLERAGIQTTPKGLVQVDGQFRTNVSHIFAIGDIIDGPMLAHKASEEGIVVAEIMAGQKPMIDYMAIPNVVYTYPEAAAVGLTEAEAKTLGLSTRSGLFPFKANSRARCTGEEEGFVKIITEERSDRIVGIHILGPHASELIAEGALAIEKGLTALDIANTPHAHPTLSEAMKEAALAVHKRAIHL